MAVVSREAEEDADEERWVRYGSAPLIATLVLPIIIGVILLLKCVFHHCCVRKTTSKDEMYGLEGRMTMLATADSNFSTTLLPANGTTSITPGTSRPNTNQSGSPLPSDSDGITMLSLVDQHRDRENIRDDPPKDLPFGKAVVPPGAHVDLPTPPPFFEDGVPKRFSGSGSTQLKLGSATNDSSELSGTLKRAAAQHRQLPDLPPTPHGVSRISQPPRRSSSVLSNDGTSELYATVGLVNGTGDQPTASSVPSRARGNEATPSSDSETYAGSNSHHPYAKLKKNVAEHPYARVRGNASSANNNDEETDTDNYDLPQFLNNSRQGGAPGNVQSPTSSTSSVNRHLPSSSGAQNIEGSGRRNSDDVEGPVPPRRVGREWRRPGPNQPPENLHFSGDSQDSRGYTSISVREPLSNIRNEVVAVPARNFDSHYATVSDDSEEMYAAIDDPSDPSYMRIGDRQRDNNSRPSWMGGPNVSSPIPERREANSPLPPVPNVPPPDPSPGPSSSTIPPPLSPHSQLQSQPPPPPPQSTTLPVYAQVSKKSKKQQPKAPLTNTLSNTSTASSQQTLREGVSGAHSESPMLREASSAMALHPPQHRSKRAASLMDNTNTMDAESVDTRRWSKADISYSEFEVVRENVFVPMNTNADVRQSNPIPLVGSDTVDAILTKTLELLDEDNYNIIPDKSSRNQRHTPTTPSSNVQRELDSGNYHEIEPKNLNNTYQEIGCGKEPSDHYQEIGRDGSELYQEIDRKDRHSDDDDDEEDEADQFYERVKKPGFEGKKKHGYEKIKKKGGPTPSSSVHHPTSDRRFANDAVEDDDDDGPDEMYECVKYPPYERLKEMEDDMESEDGKGSNYYEDIGYTRVKHKNKASLSQNQAANEAKEKNKLVEEKSSATSVETPVQDVHQLYAQIDKTKKRKGKANSSATSTTISNIIKVEDIRVNNNEPNLTIPSSSGIINNDEQRVILKGTNSSRSPVNRNTESHFTDGADSKNRLANDNSIEYI